MDYETFTRTAAERAGLPVDTVERVEHATLRTLADRISGGEAQDLASQLPSRLRADLRPAREQAETLTHATLRVLAERLTGGKADDLRAQPPGELQADLIPPTPEAGESRPAVAMSSAVSSTKSRYLFRSSLVDVDVARSAK